MNKYCVSTLWVKHDSNRQVLSLRSEFVNALSHDEAVGISIRKWSCGEMEGHNLSTYTVLIVTEQEAGNQ